MSILPILIAFTLVGVLVAGYMFFWAVDHDQFDDMQTPSLLPLDDLPDEPDPEAARGRKNPDQA